MGYGIIQTPRFYSDTMNWLASRGAIKNDEITEGSGVSGNYTSGDKFDIFDLNPLNTATIDTSADTDAGLLWGLDFLVTSAQPVNYMAIMNHNLVTSGAMVRVVNSDSPITTVGLADSVAGLTAIIGCTVGDVDSTATLTEDISAGETAWDVSNRSVFFDGCTINVEGDSTNHIVDGNPGSGSGTMNVVANVAGIYSNGDSIYYSDYITPSADGDLIVHFTEVTNKRYWAVEIVPNDGDFTATDVQVGSIQVGQYVDAAFGVNMNFSPSFSWGNSLKESIGGKRSSVAGWLTANDSDNAYAPFRKTSYFRRPSGREAYDFSFSYMDAADLLLDDFSGNWGSGSYLYNVINRLSGSHLPFIFVKDKTSTTEGDYLWARMTGGFNPTHESNKVYSFSGRVEQEF